MGWALVSKEFCNENKDLVASLLASTSNPDVLESMLVLVEGEVPNVSLWTEVLRADVSDNCKDAKNKSVEAALVVILREAGRSDTKVDLCLLPPLLDALFSAPPCISRRWRLWPWLPLLMPHPALPPCLTFSRTGPASPTRLFQLCLLFSGTFCPPPRPMRICRPWLGCWVWFPDTGITGALLLPP